MVDGVNWAVLAGTRMCARCQVRLELYLRLGFNMVSRAHGAVAREVKRATTEALSTYRMWLQVTVEACDTRKKLLQASRPLAL
jgi:hypothetical protein